ncbi:unnamed protein product [Dibothriocephalus latus]|uniref:Uncharacterized protein n=1 Tax=Dibothriocephalus latus TaxID=60516 RepID=A0A3P7L134_DIBLA|nr:unnamed protein product [Dibothriocephalus latus]
MTLRQTLREFVIPLETQEENQKDKKGKTSTKKPQQKYGQLRRIRSQRYKKSAKKTQTWKTFSENNDTKKKPKGLRNVPAVEIEPGEELVNLGKSILRSRRQLMQRAPARKPPAEPQSIFTEQDFKKFEADPQKFFCS